MAVFSQGNLALTLDCLEEGCRLDGRDGMDMRDVAFCFANDPGQVEISLGGTRVMCVVSGEIVIPSREWPNEGLLSFRVNFGSLASSSTSRYFEEEANEICSIIERLLKGSRAIDTEALCISAGLEVWSIKVEVRALEADGNLKDACALAAVAGLLHFRREDKRCQTDVCGKKAAEIGSEMPLSIHHIPILLTFGFSGSETICVLDPTAAEEEVLTGTLSLAVNQFRDLCGIHKPGGEPLRMKAFASILEVAEKQSRIVIQKLEKALASDSERERSKRQRLHYRYSSSALQVDVPSSMPLWKHDNAPSILTSPVPWSRPSGLPPQHPAEALLFSPASLVTPGSSPIGYQPGASLESKVFASGEDVPGCNTSSPQSGESFSSSFQEIRQVSDDITTVKKPTHSSTAFRNVNGVDGSDGDSDLANAVKRRKKALKKKR